MYAGIDYGKIREIVKEEIRKSGSIDRALLTIVAEILEEEYRDKEALNYLRWFGWPQWYDPQKHFWDYGFRKHEWFTYLSHDEARPYFEVSGGGSVTPLTIKAHRVSTTTDYSFFFINRYYWNPYRGVYVYARISGGNNIAYVQKFLHVGSPMMNQGLLRVFYNADQDIRLGIYGATVQSIKSIDTDWHNVEMVTFGDRHAIFWDGELVAYLNDPAYRAWFPCSIGVQMLIKANSETEADSYLYLNKLVVTELREPYVKYSTKPVAIGTTDTTVFAYYYARVRRLIFVNPTAGTINFTVKDADGNEYIRKGVAAGDTVVLDVDGLLMKKIIAVADASGGYIVALIDL